MMTSFFKGVEENVEETKWRGWSAMSDKGEKKEEGF